jgi:hypothetical protein
LFAQASSDDKTLKSWPGAKHADVFHGGAGFDQAIMQGGYDAVGAWIMARSSADTTSAPT